MIDKELLFLRGSKAIIKSVILTNKSSFNGLRKQLNRHEKKNDYLSHSSHIGILDK